MTKSYLLSLIQEGSLFHVYYCFPLSNHLKCGEGCSLIIDMYIDMFFYKKLVSKISYYVGINIVKTYLKYIYI